MRIESTLPEPPERVSLICSNSSGLHSSIPQQPPQFDDISLDIKQSALASHHWTWMDLEHPLMRDPRQPPLDTHALFPSRRDWVHRVKAQSDR